MEHASENPFAFISHAAADNERFVIPLDVALRARGIRTFFDKRDLLIGQNLIDRIFDYGMGNADFVVLVLSKNTADSSFVHREMTTAVAGEIYGRFKAVFTILLDGVEVPLALSAYKYRRATAQEASVEELADEIRDAIFGRAEAPIAAVPAYVALPVHGLSGLTPDDERVFRLVAELHLDVPRWHPAVLTPDIVEAASHTGMSDRVVYDCLEVLKHRGYLSDLHWELGTPVPYAVDPSPFAIAEFLRSYRPREYRRAQITIVASIVNGESELGAVLPGTGITEPLAIVILDELKSEGVLDYDMYSEGTYVTGTPMLSRLLDRLRVEPLQ